MNKYTAVNDYEILAEFARDCAEHKYKNLCKQECSNCASNIRLYGLNPKMATIIQHAADIERERKIRFSNSIDAENAKYIREYNHKSFMASLSDFAERAIKIVLTIIVVLILFIVVTRSKQSTPAPVPVVATAPTIKPVVTTPVPKTDPLEPIRETLRRIYPVDMNHDGDVDCIDYAIQFYQYYPNRNDVRIIWSNNKNFNHLFVRVNGIDVEPGAYLRQSNTEKWFGMKKFWGDRYDPSYNRDITDDYESIRDGTRWQ
jgi:hypothetical protein